MISRLFPSALMLCAIAGTIGCDAPPQNTVPKVDAIVAAFRGAKDQCTEYASVAKNRVAISRRIEKGHSLYGDAKAAHNEVIARLITAITSEVPIPREELKTLLQDADTKRRRFIEWYEEVVSRRIGGPVGRQGAGDAAAASGSVDAVVSLASVLAELAKLHNQKAAEQRRVLRRELEQCKWSEW